MPLSAADCERARYHTGYLEVAPAPSLVLGMPRMSQTAFLIENAFSTLLESAVPRVIKILDTMDAIEAQMTDGLGRLKAEKLDTLTLRKDEIDSLEHEYVRWANRLANILGCPLYPFAERFSGGAHASGGAGMIPRVH